MARLFSIALVFLMTSCASLPMQQMSDARQAIEAARDAGAEKHAKKLFQQAETLLSDAERLQQENRYGLSADAAIKARDMAIAAQKAAASVREPQP